jgi:hypothetical protein
LEAVAGVASTFSSRIASRVTYTRSTL